MEKTECQSRCSFLELLVLALLINEGKMHGYALRKKIVSATRKRWDPSIGTIYRMLNSMLEKNLVEKSAEGRKQVYSITQKGVKYFTEISGDLLTRRVGVLAELLRAYFMIAEKNPSIVDEHLKENLKILKEVLDDAQKIFQK